MFLIATNTKPYYSLLLICCICCINTVSSRAQENNRLDTTPFSTQKQALDYLNQQSNLKASNYWPKINPTAFITNLTKNVQYPLSLYEGRNTNFCSYAALSYLPLHDNPLGFVQFMIALYSNGTAVYGNTSFNPSKEIRLVAGTLRFKGELDIRPADQLWFLSLADRFKGYLNILDHHYNVGDENRMWASVNYAKFNRMIRHLFNYEVHAAGSDLLKPAIGNVFTYLSERLQTGRVALFVNNMYLYKRNHTGIRPGIPTHFIILLKVEEVGDKIAFTYWDYGGKSLQELSPYFLKKIIFGISHITPKTNHAK